MLSMGIDDAGRGPLIGPMILAGVLIDGDGERFLKRAGVKDSKMLEHTKRIKLAKKIKEFSLNNYVAKAFPNEIDTAISEGVNLNTLEAVKIAEVINKINSGKYRKEKIKVIVDCPSVNIDKWKGTLMKYIKYSDNLNVICEHKADVNHVAVSAASIVAKCSREDELEKIKKSFGETGSGYPADPLTQKFLKNHGKELKDSGIFRKSWQTWKEVFPDKKQKTLGEF